jgi:Uma2 family endonuclease
MAAKVLMDVEEYLGCSFDGADCEYLDGEIVERNMGEMPHSTVQKILMFLLTQMESRLGIQVQPEIRIQTGPRRYRVADIAVWRAGYIGERIPTVPPFLVIEILSPEDRTVRMLPKVREYLDLGAEWIWLIDPEERQALCFSQQNPAGGPCHVLKTENPAIEIPLATVLAGRLS